MVNENMTSEVKISNEVIAAIAANAAKTVDGVSGLTDGLVDSVTKVLSGTYTRGVDVDINDVNSTISLSLVVKYDFFIPEIAEKVQISVKKSVQKMTGIEIGIVNINIQGINFSEDTVVKK